MQPSRRAENIASSKVPLSDLAVDDEILAAVSEVVASGWWSAGPRVAEFEQAFARFIGAEHAIALSSGSAALHLSAIACGLGPGDEVVTTPEQLPLDVARTVAAPAPKVASFAAIQNQEDAPPCSTCGSIMVRSGACYKCTNCGTTSGCA